MLTKEQEITTWQILCSRTTIGLLFNTINHFLNPLSGCTTSSLSDSWDKIVSPWLSEFV